jgi:hypothetical protein
MLDNSVYANDNNYDYGNNSVLLGVPIHSKQPMKPIRTNTQKISTIGFSTTG